MYTITLPLRLVSLNRNLGRGWRGFSKDRKQQRTVSRQHVFIARRSGLVAGPPFDVRIIRLGVGWLDEVNLAAACKHVQDGIADGLGFDDSRKSPITWTFAQEKAKTYGVRIEISGGIDEGQR